MPGYDYLIEQGLDPEDYPDFPTEEEMHAIGTWSRRFEERWRDGIREQHDRMIWAITTKNPGEHNNSGDSEMLHQGIIWHILIAVSAAAGIALTLGYLLIG